MVDNILYCFPWECICSTTVLRPYLANIAYCSICVILVISINWNDWEHLYHVYSYICKMWLIVIKLWKQLEGFFLWFLHSGHSSKLIPHAKRVKIKINLPRSSVRSNYDKKHIFYNIKTQKLHVLKTKVLSTKINWRWWASNLEEARIPRKSIRVGRQCVSLFSLIMQYEFSFHRGFAL